MGAFDGLRDGQIQHGYFGNHTSTIDWCETNYSHTPYIAEFVNTLTNFPSILLGIYGAYAGLRDGIRKRYALTYLGLTLVGLGSFGFHASLRWEWQLMDELPMIYVVSQAFYLILDTRPTFVPRFGLLGPLILILWDISVTLSYLYLPNPIYHQIAFAGIMLTCVGRNVVLIRRLPTQQEVGATVTRSVEGEKQVTPAKRNLKEASTGTTVGDDRKRAPLPQKRNARSKISRTLLQGIITFAAGFAVWNVDNVFCDQLRYGREVMQRYGVGALGFLLQGHGYWHILTGYGSFLIFTASTLLQLAVKVSPDAYDYDETSWIPTVYKVDKTPTTSSADAATGTDDAPDTKVGGKTAGPSASGIPVNASEEVKGRST